MATDDCPSGSEPRTRQRSMSRGRAPSRATTRSRIDLQQQPTRAHRGPRCQWGTAHGMHTGMRAHRVLWLWLRASRAVARAQTTRGPPRRSRPRPPLRRRPRGRGRRTVAGGMGRSAARPRSPDPPPASSPRAQPRAAGGLSGGGGGACTGGARAAAAAMLVCGRRLCVGVCAEALCPHCLPRARLDAIGHRRLPLVPVHLLRHLGGVAAPGGLGTRICMSTSTSMGISISMSTGTIKHGPPHQHQARSMAATSVPGDECMGEPRERGNQHAIRVSSVCNQHAIRSQSYRATSVWASRSSAAGGTSARPSRSASSSAELGGIDREPPPRRYVTCACEVHGCAHVRAP